jgi:hypothetical protein
MTKPLRSRTTSGLTKFCKSIDGERDKLLSKESE